MSTVIATKLTTKKSLSPSLNAIFFLTYIYTVALCQVIKCWKGGVWVGRQIASQNAVAKSWGLSGGGLSHLLSGYRGLSWGRCKALAPKLGVDPGFLMDATPDVWRGLVMAARIELAKRRKKTKGTKNSTSET